MKVAINKEYGGFGLSDAAIERCIQLGMILTTYNSEGGYVNPKANFVDCGEPTADKRQWKRQRYHEIDKFEKDFRINPTIIKVIEEMGEAANGAYAYLVLVDIPFENTDDWYIDDYDGYETVRENHRCW